MRIISKFKDYYDHFASNPKLSDFNYRYVRKTTVLDVHYSDVVSDVSIEGGRLYFGCLYFCGEPYPIVVIERNLKEQHIFTVEDLGEGNLYTAPFDTAKHWLEKGRRRFYFSQKTVKNIAPLPIHKKLKSPCFLVLPNKMIVDPDLKHIGFSRVLGAWEAFLKLEVFLSNELAPRDEIAYQPSDKLKIESHGFNKFSFRKEKTS
jgi:hypothetical protein